jgi:glycosyltransferase involved in cell wall biosynthesis
MMQKSKNTKNNNIVSLPLLPKISIVTPSYNQDKFIEETICSVLNQNYNNLEYIIIDGKSTDNSVDIIRKYEKQLSYWVSEPDKGQYDAINKGFVKCTGDIMAWINSDDKYTPWAFSIISEIFTTFPEIDWLTTAYNLYWDDQGRAIMCSHHGGFSKKAFFKGANLTGTGRYSRGYIQQESTFWRKSLWEKAGGFINPNLKMAGDFELWAKFFQHSRLFVVTTPLSGFRFQQSQKTANFMRNYIEEAEVILNSIGYENPYGRLESSIRKTISNCIGYGAISTKRFSPLTNKLLMKIPLFYPVCQCVWTSKGWALEEAFII